MKSTRKSIVAAAVILAVVFAVSSVALARGYWREGGGYCSGQGFGGPEFGGPGSMGTRFGLMQDLNLSDEQRDQALKITESHQIEMIKARGDLIKAHDTLRDALQADTLNEEKVRQAYKKLSSLREDRLVARAKMMSELKAILTPEQVKLLDERTADRPDRKQPRWGGGRPFPGGRFGDCPRW